MRLPKEQGDLLKYFIRSSKALDSILLMAGPRPATFPRSQNRHSRNIGEPKSRDDRKRENSGPHPRGAGSFGSNWRLSSRAGCFPSTLYTLHSANVSRSGLVATRRRIV